MGASDLLNHPTFFLVATTLWGGLIFLPSLGVLWVNRLIYRSQFRRAYHLFRFLSFLHPFDGWRDANHIYKALMLEQQGFHEEAEKLLKSFEATDSDVGRSAMIRMFMFGGEWEEFVQWGEKLEHRKWLDKNFHYLPTYLRALAETGRLKEFFEFYPQWKKVSGKFRDDVLKNVVWLVVFVFTGKKELVEKILSGPLSIYNEAQKKSSIGTALWAAGDEVNARLLLSEAMNIADPMMKRGIQRRLHLGIKPFLISELSPEQQQIILEIEKDFLETTRYHSSYHPTRWRAYTTYSLILINLLVFLFEMKGGSSDPENLYHLGALFYFPDEPGGFPQWWRFITVNFLHLGFVHLLMNLMGLWVIGRLLEYLLGKVKFLACYFVSGIGAMILIFLSHLYYFKQSIFVVGASACIMGLVGGTAALMLKEWRRENSQLAKKELRSMLLIIFFQAGLDFFVPQFSFMGHFFGAVIGFLLVLLLPFKRSELVQSS